MDPKVRCILTAKSADCSESSSLPSVSRLRSIIDFCGPNIYSRKREKGNHPIPTLMFGPRRRRPLLGAALIAGTATVAAKHGAKEQAQVEAERKYQMERDAELGKYAEESQRIQNQRAIDQAVNDALAKQASNNSQSQLAPPGPAAAAPRSPSANLAPDVRGPSPALPPYPYPAGGPAGQDFSSMPGSGSAMESGFRFCTGCGNRCTLQDSFCSRCGRAQARLQPIGRGV